MQLALAQGETYGKPLGSGAGPQAGAEQGHDNMIQRGLIDIWEPWWTVRRDEERCITTQNRSII